jgi:hypothetical protein
VAASTAAIHAVRRPKSTCPAHHATGTATTANSSERTWVASSERPATAIQRLSSR